MQLDWPILSVLIWLPIFGGVVMLALGERGVALGRWIALLTTAATFGISTLLWVHFDSSTALMQFTEERGWIDIPGTLVSTYSLGVDGISMPLILLTTFITPLVVIASWTVIEKKPAQYYAAFLILEGLMIGVFASLDALLFYVLWEAMLIPMFIIIGIWGGPRRVYATIKFFLYTSLGSVLMLVSLIYLYQQTCNVGECSYLIADFYDVPLDLNTQIVIFLAFLTAFAVKVPMWPVHTWLPDAHVEAPTGGSAVLAAIMLKLGAYGFLRFSMPIAPDASREWAWLIIALSLIAVIYVGLVAMVQQDMKKLVAYSSVAHMGFVTLGFFIFDHVGIAGGLVQMIAHGFVSGAMFLCIGVLYDRVHSRDIDRYGGLADRMPLYAFTFMVFTMANVGLPGTSGFVGEFLALIGTFKANIPVATIATFGVILSACYALWLYRK